MKIALDYDNTYTADPELWQAFVILAQLRQHEVYIVTTRHPVDDTIEGLTLPIIYCDGNPKKTIAESLGHEFGIWIDDTPESITNKSGFTFVELERWREGGRISAT